MLNERRRSARSKAGKPVGFSGQQVGETVLKRKKELAGSEKGLDALDAETTVIVEREGGLLTRLAMTFGLVSRTISTEYPDNFIPQEAFEKAVDVHTTITDLASGQQYELSHAEKGTVQAENTDQVSKIVPTAQQNSHIQMNNQTSQEETMISNTHTHDFNASVTDMGEEPLITPYEPEPVQGSGYERFDSDDWVHHDPEAYDRAEKTKHDFKAASAVHLVTWGDRMGAAGIFGAPAAKGASWVTGLVPTEGLQSVSGNHGAGADNSGTSIDSFEFGDGGRGDDQRMDDSFEGYGSFDLAA